MRHALPETVQELQECKMKASTHGYDKGICGFRDLAAAPRTARLCKKPARCSGQSRPLRCAVALSRNRHAVAHSRSKPILRRLRVVIFEARRRQRAADH